MKKLFVLLVSLLGFCMSLTSQTLSKETIVLETPAGIIQLKLYEETPLHKANFLKLVKEGFYDSLLFHRVINQFMIQGGDPLSKRARPGDSLGHGDPGYTVPAELNPVLIHKRGALAAAREGDEVNPLFASSGSQFYIVMGKKRSLEDLKKYEDRINNTRYNQAARTFINSEQGKQLKKAYNRLKAENQTDSADAVNLKIQELVKAEHLKSPEYKFSEQQRQAYTTAGGTPHLDGSYTVFGEVVEGLDIVDKIAAVKTDARNRPLSDVRMRVRIAE